MADFIMAETNFSRKPISRSQRLTGIFDENIESLTAIHGVESVFPAEFISADLISSIFAQIAEFFCTDDLYEFEHHFMPMEGSGITSALIKGKPPIISPIECIDQLWGNIDHVVEEALSLPPDEVIGVIATREDDDNNAEFCLDDGAKNVNFEIDNEE